MKKLTYILIAFILFAGVVVAASLKPYAFPFIGRWQPTEDPVLIDDYGFQDIQNLRKDGKRLKGVSGHTKINTSVWDATYQYPKNGFQFKKDQPSETHTIVLATDASGANGTLYQNTTAIPSQGNFSGTVLYSDDSSAGLGRFSAAPKGNMAYCNGEETLIWGGDEITATSFIVSPSAITSTITNPKDFTDEVRNTRQAGDEVAQITDGLDSNTVLLLHCEGADASTTFTDSSDTGHADTNEGDAQIDTDFKKFGGGSGIFDGAGDYVSYPDHANWNFGSDEVTIETWIYFNSDTDKHAIYSQTAEPNYVEIWQDQDADKIWFSVMGGETRLILESATWNPTINTWYHLALIRGWGGGANDWAITVDGSAIHTFTDSDTLPDLAAALYVGSSDNTVEVDHGDTGHAITYVVTAINSSAESKFGSGSLSLDGNSDSVNVPDSDEFDMVGSTTTSKTLSFWVKHDDHAGDEFYSGQYESSENYWRLWHTSGSGMRFAAKTGNSIVIDTGYGGEITDTDWHHIALVKVDDEYAVYKDGTQVLYVQDSSIDTYADTLDIGYSGGMYLDGNIDDFILTDNNLYGAVPNVGLSDTITVPTSPHTSDSNTKLLLHFDTKDFNGQIDEFRVSKDSSRWVSTFDPPVRPYRSIGLYWLIGSTRPLQGVKYYVKTANYTASTTTVKEWNGSSWEDLSITDNTKSGGVSLAQTGTVTWATTEDTSKTAVLQGLSLFWYQFAIDAGEAEIYYTTVDAPIQTIKNIWSTDPSPCVNFNVYHGAAWKDYTLEINSESSKEYSTDLFAADVSAQTNAEYIYAGFMEQQTALHVKMTVDINANAAVATVYYWDGGAWVSVGALVDGTDVAGNALSQSGYISWNAPAKEEEFTQNLFGLSFNPHLYDKYIGSEPRENVPGEPVVFKSTPIFEAVYGKKLAAFDNTNAYFYKIVWSETLSATVKIDTVSGVPATYEVPGYKFPTMFQNRLFLFTEEAGMVNTCIYSAYENPDSLNGKDSGYIYFGDETEIIAAATLYNLYQTVGIEQLIVTKAHETYRLVGSGPETWEKYQMSATIGCIAPLSMATCDASETEEGLKRQVVIWQTDNGVVATDGAKIDEISKDIACYWDANDSRAIPTNRLDDSVGWYDPSLKAYKLLISSGSGQTTHNVELEYSLENKEWIKLYREDGSGANPLQAGFVVHDTTGKSYTYGTTNDAYVYRLEDGKTWNGTGIEQYVHTKDLMLDAEQPLFKHTNIDYLRLIFTDKATGDGEDIDIIHYCDQTQTTHGSNDQAVPTDIDMADGPHELRESTLGPCLYHSFKLTATTSTVSDGMELTGMGLYYESIKTIME